MYEVIGAGVIAGSQRDLRPFDLVVPATVAEAVEILNTADDPVLYAGGTDICAAFREGRQVGTLIWLRDLDELRTVAKDGERLSIGALMTHEDGGLAPECAAIPGFANAWHKLSNGRIRWKATIGGNLMARRPRYEMFILLAALDGALHYATPAGPSSAGVREALAAPAPARALLTEVTIPLRPDLQLDYDRSLRPIMTLAFARWSAAHGAGAGRAAVATEYLYPVAFDVDFASGGTARDIAEAAFAALPEDFADVATGHGYLRDAGAAILARQIERTGGADG